MLFFRRITTFAILCLAVMMLGCAAKQEPPPPPTIEELYDSMSCMWEAVTELMFVYEIASIVHDGWVNGEDVLWRGNKEEILQYLSKKFSERGDKKDDALYTFGDCLYEAIRSFR